MLVPVSAIASFQDGFGGSGLLRLAVVAGAVTLAFAGVARLLRGVTRGGAVAGALVSFLLYLGTGAGAFITLIAVFIVTLGATRVGYSQKQRLGTAERGDGRTASQVLANLGVAAAAALAYLIVRDSALTLACVAALAEAAADTVSSEIGQTASASARLITTWERVPAGTDGGVSLSGTLAGTLAALLIAMVARLAGLLSWHAVVIPFVAAVAGMLFDSILGAWLERRSLLNNDSVNFLSTLTAAGIAAAIAIRVQ